MFGVSFEAFFRINIYLSNAGRDKLVAEESSDLFQ